MTGCLGGEVLSQERWLHTRETNGEREKESECERGQGYVGSGEHAYARTCVRWHVGSHMPRVCYIPWSTLDVCRCSLWNFWRLGGPLLYSPL